jgi:hypothetical protein
MYGVTGVPWYLHIAGWVVYKVVEILWGWYRVLRLKFLCSLVLVYFAWVQYVVCGLIHVFFLYILSRRILLLCRGGLLVSNCTTQQDAKHKGNIVHLTESGSDSRVRHPWPEPIHMMEGGFFHWWRIRKKCRVMPWSILCWPRAHPECGARIFRMACTCEFCKELGRCTSKVPHTFIISSVRCVKS